MSQSLNFTYFTHGYQITTAILWDCAFTDGGASSGIQAANADQTLQDIVQLLT
jgi:hypothetical protein